MTPKFCVKNFLVPIFVSKIFFAQNFWSGQTAIALADGASSDSLESLNLKVPKSCKKVKKAATFKINFKAKKA